MTSRNGGNGGGHQGQASGNANKNTGDNDNRTGSETGGSDRGGNERSASDKGAGDAKQGKGAGDAKQGKGGENRQQAQGTERQDDEDINIDQMVATQLDPFTWWTDAVAAALGLPPDGVVDHYHPLRLLEKINLKLLETGKTDDLGAVVSTDTLDVSAAVKLA